MFLNHIQRETGILFAFIVAIKLSFMMAFLQIKLYCWVIGKIEKRLHQWVTEWAREGICLPIFSCLEASSNQALNCPKGSLATRKFKFFYSESSESMIRIIGKSQNSLYIFYYFDLSLAHKYLFDPFEFVHVNSQSRKFNFG